MSIDILGYLSHLKYVLKIDLKKNCIGTNQIAMFDKFNNIILYDNYITLKIQISMP